MPDCIPATIAIGGKLQEAKLAKLRDLLPPTGDLHEAIKDGKPFYGEDGDAAWGDFSELEQFCRKNKLTYRRTTQAKYENDGEVVFWQPGMKEPISNRATQDGCPYAVLPCLKAALEKGDTLRDVVDSLSQFSRFCPALKVVKTKGRKP